MGVCMDAFSVNVPMIVPLPLSDLISSQYACLFRAEKSEVLNEEQQKLERRVDVIQKTCQNLQKKIQACLTSQGQQLDSEKRMVN